MPFGLCNGLATFQRCMISIFSNLVEQCMEFFLDDFFVFGSSFDNCLTNLEKILKRCREKNLTLNWEKCGFMVKKRIVVGHVISSDDIEVDKGKINLIANLVPPTCVKEVSFFLGDARFYCRFIQDFNKIVKPLSSLLAKDVPFHFFKECLDTFTKLREALTTAPILHPPVWGEPFELMCGASGYGVGVILGQRIGKKPMDLLC